MKEIFFVDVSYLLFHRFFAIVSWSKLKKVELTEEETYARFLKGLDDFIIKMKKKLAIEDFKNVFFVKDTNRSTIWRLEHFSEYKKNRDDNKQNFNPNIMAYAHDIVLPILKSKYGFNEINIHTAEADDIIAVSTKLTRKLYPDCNISIITNDNDFVQLTLSPMNATIYNALWINIGERFNDEMLSVYTEWKVIKGDKSDNIPAIDKKIGDKTALKLAQSPELLAKKLENPKVLEQYNLNKLLISFDSIPKSLQHSIETEFKKMI